MALYRTGSNWRRRRRRRVRRRSRREEDDENANHRPQPPPPKAIRPLALFAIVDARTYSSFFFLFICLFQFHVRIHARQKHLIRPWHNCYHVTTNGFLFFFCGNDCQEASHKSIRFQNHQSKSWTKLNFLIIGQPTLSTAGKCCWISRATAQTWDFGREKNNMLGSDSRKPINHHSLKAGEFSSEITPSGAFP